MLWDHATKFFRDNSSVKYIKCIHCGKTFYGGSTSKALKHLKSIYYNHFIASLESKNKPSQTYELKCELKQKFKDGIEKIKHKRITTMI